MNQIEFTSMPHRQIHLVENDPHSILSSKLSVVPNNTTSSISSTIWSMCPLSIDVNNYPLINDNQPITKTNSTEHLLVNTSLCKICKKFNVSIESDICLQCHHGRLRSNSFRIISTEQNFDNQNTTLQSIQDEKISNKDKKQPLKKNTSEIFDLSQSESKKKLDRKPFTRLLSFSRQRESCPEFTLNPSSSSLQSCLSQLVFQPKLSFEEEDPVETTNCSLSVPIPAPASSPVCNSVFHIPQLSPEQISYYKKRQTELDHTVSELIKHLKCKTNENINQISKHWAYIKHLCLTQIQPKTNLNQAFHYLLKSIHPNKEFEDYLKENDDVRAVLGVLSTTLNIVQDTQSLSTINNLFDSEGKTMIANLRSELEFLLASYTDALSMINEFSDFHQTSLKEADNFHLIAIIKKDYPSLIEQISNDYITKVPQVEQILVTLLGNMKNRLLYNNCEFINKSDK
ncbi:unnamed protein product [Rotaria sordida]|uniref:Uncharacterized protein n=1 Tax=Rotaria sordida TaxID=392033 RepID=A0A814P8U8_9BILA|nr:unnamed protein product [Rotaria sordida]CAF1102039.1 unnamed protein product [Rotaria sordida]CAF1122356.1 unnamed protein product [Rotaria sordida]CAF3711219.1 unnamed protein product [Rotaria sordida]CAF4030141.1 unnamed protein product [Rotaria sordida]